MTVNARRKRAGDPEGNPPRPPQIIRSTRPITDLETWYLSCLRLLYKHLGRAPSIVELATYCEKTINPTWVAMRSLESKGAVTRAGTGSTQEDRRFVPVNP